MKEHIYIAIDLKSFYASVECRERGLDPLTTNLVVADASRTEKTICLAVSPSLKAYGIPGRARLFEVVQKVREVNAMRRTAAGGHRLSESSSDAAVIAADPDVAVGYITAPPRMALYMEYSTRIYNIYMKYVAPEDVHVYSIDEVFIDASPYLGTYGMTARELASKMIRDVYEQTGITATAGIGTNLYLCKIAMDIEAKHARPDEHGVRIAFLDEKAYRKKLWNHRPITDFWRVGRGYAKKLEEKGICTMGDIARCSVGRPGDFYNEELLYKMFGVNAELLIDHAWGYEPCTMAQIKAYRPESNSIGSGQVLHCPYDYTGTRLVVREMADQLALDLAGKGLVTDQLVLTIGYDIDNLSNADIARNYHGEVTADRYGRRIPKPAHGTGNLPVCTSSSRILIDSATKLYERITNPGLLIRRINITANHVVPNAAEPGISAHSNTTEKYEQLSLFDTPGFDGYDERKKQEDKMQDIIEKDDRMQQVVLDIKKRYGRNAILKGMNYEEGATAIQRNSQIGGHRA